MAYACAEVLQEVHKYTAEDQPFGRQWPFTHLLCCNCWIISPSLEKCVGSSISLNSACGPI